MYLQRQNLLRNDSSGPPRRGIAANDARGSVISFFRAPSPQKRRHFARAAQAAAHFSEQLARPAFGKPRRGGPVYPCAHSSERPGATPRGSDVITRARIYYLGGPACERGSCAECWYVTARELRKCHFFGACVRHTPLFNELRYSRARAREPEVLPGRTSTPPPLCGHLLTAVIPATLAAPAPEAAATCHVTPSQPDTSTLLRKRHVPPRVPRAKTRAKTCPRLSVTHLLSLA